MPWGVSEVFSYFYQCIFNNECLLLLQKHICSSCGDPPEAHVYSYTHRNGNITVLVNQLPPEKCLSGERDGKIWMWTRCLRCEPQSMMKTSPRVSFSTESLSLSFGKFLELGFSSHFAAIKLKCGHSLHRDCLRFFGYVHHNQIFPKKFLKFSS